MQKYFNNVADQNGNALFGASVVVSSNSGPITIYSDNGVTPIAANTLTTDANGYFAFYAANGRYNISITATGITSQSITDILLEDVLAPSIPLGVANGGTGLTTLTAHNVMLGEGSSNVAFAAPGTSGNILASTGAASDPTFQTKAALTIASSGANSDITSLSGLSTALSVVQGGTGRSALTIHGVLIGETAAAIGQTAAGTTGQMLLGVTGADPAFGGNPTITGGTIDGSAIGGGTPAAGAFTTLSASTAMTVPSGGTGRAILTNHGVLVGAAAAAISQTSAGTTGQSLISQGAAADPVFGVTLPVGGGTGLATLTAHGVLLGEGTSNVAFAAPGAIGQMLLSAGASADPVFGNNPTITGGTIDGAVIGGTTKAAGSFTTVVATGTITPSSTNGIVGTTTNDSANAGSVGEYITASATAQSASSGVAFNVTSISLTTGDWDVQGLIAASPAGSTVVQAFLASSSSTSATIAATPFRSQVSINQTGIYWTQIIPVARYSLSTTTTIYLVSSVTFTTSTLTCDGFIRARRVR